MAENKPLQLVQTEADLSAPAPAFKVCGQCRSRFSGDARFCPFDGDPLRALLPSEESPDPLLGAVVDERYEVQAVLGEGGMGTVYRVRHRVLERPFALKVLREDLSRDSSLGVRFHREARAAASISHPNVVQITDFGSMPSGQPYFVMELLTGDALSTLVRKGGPLPAARAVRLLRQIVDALAAAHAAGVVHRDLKPDNILVCPQAVGESAKVLDFGLAKVAGQSRLTKAGLVFGTPHYMSPEQASGGTVDERTDVYAVGVIMYEMFTGRVPFEADTYMGVLTKHLYVAPTPPSVHLGGIAELGALEQVTLRCLEKKPERRFGSMAELRAELSRVARFSDDGVLRVAPAEPGERRPFGLADELELPTSGELRHVLSGRAGTSVGRAAAVGAVLVSAFTLSLGAGLLWQSRPSENHAGSPASSSTVLPASTAASGPAPRASAARPASPVAASEPAPAPSGAVPVAPPRAVASAGSSGEALHLPAKAKAPPTPKGSPEAQRPVAPKYPTDKEKMPSGEIVDPWSR